MGQNHEKLEYSKVIGVDLGGTKVTAGLIIGDRIIDHHTNLISSDRQEEVIMQEVITTIQKVITPDAVAIGIGVPSVVDVDKGVVYEVQNIPSWIEVPVKAILETRFKLPVYVDNDANCFTIGEHYFGKGQNADNLVGLIMGTGNAAGIVTNGKLYRGSNCGAGEYGMMPYLEHNFEYYCSGNFFTTFHNHTGQSLAAAARKGEKKALEVFREFGKHAGELLKAIIYAQDPSMIILGGSVSKSFLLFEDTLRSSLDTFAYSRSIKKLVLEVSQNPQIALLGASALYYDLP